MHHSETTARRSAALTSLFLVALSCPGLAPAQGTSGPTVSDSGVGYIDVAIPGNLLLFRGDAGYDFRRPNRAEFFYPRSSPAGPGLPFPEPNVDYQEFFVHAETLLTPSSSVFVEAGARLLNPEVNDNTAGAGDMNVGFKWAFLYTPERVTTFQLRTYLPTGDADRGLGTNHVSIEPALLTFRNVTERLALSGELRYWIPVGGTDFAGDIVRYGLGAQYQVFGNDTWYVRPVAEVIGWTALGGRQSVTTPGGLTTIEGAAGDTVVNLKAGVRLGWRDRGDLYVGYGRPLTGDRWYENTVRLELRLFYGGGRCRPRARCLCAGDAAPEGW